MGHCPIHELDIELRLPSTWVRDMLERARGRTSQSLIDVQILSQKKLQLKALQLLRYFHNKLIVNNCYFDPFIIIRFKISISSITALCPLYIRLSLSTALWFTVVFEFPNKFAVCINDRPSL
jgi:hypothetical protein